VQENFKSRTEWEIKTLSDFMIDYTRSDGTGPIDWESLAEGIIGRGYRLCQLEQKSTTSIGPYSRKGTLRAKLQK